MIREYAAPVYWGLALGFFFSGLVWFVAPLFFMGCLMILAGVGRLAFVSTGEEPTNGQP